MAKSLSLTVPSPFKSALAFQLASVLELLKALAKVIRSKPSTLPESSMSPGRACAMWTEEMKKKRKKERGEKSLLRLGRHMTVFLSLRDGYGHPYVM